MTTAEMLRKKGEERGVAKGLAKGLATGLARGKAEALLAVLSGRDLPISEEIRNRILSCRDLVTLDRWLARAGKATSAADVVDE